VDDLNPIVIGKVINPRTGLEEDDIVFRGFYITNSEVGKSSLKIAGGGTETTQPGERSCPAGYVVLDKPNQYGAFCEPKEGLPKTTPEACKFGMFGTPPNDCNGRRARNSRVTKVASWSWRVAKWSGAVSQGPMFVLVLRAPVDMPESMPIKMAWLVVKCYAVLTNDGWSAGLLR
jgi:hypothetical protein